MKRIVTFFTLTVVLFCLCVAHLRWIRGGASLVYGSDPRIIAADIYANRFCMDPISRHPRP